MQNRRMSRLLVHSLRNRRAHAYQGVRLQPTTNGMMEMVHVTRGELAHLPTRRFAPGTVRRSRDMATTTRGGVLAF